MWFSSKLFDLFKIAKDSVDDLRTENATLKIERDHLLRQAADARANFEWIRVKVNSLELERAALLERLYGIKVAAPEVVTRVPNPLPDFTNFSFEDVGDDMAKKLGLPTFNS